MASPKFPQRRALGRYRHIHTGQCVNMHKAKRKDRGTTMHFFYRSHVPVHMDDATFYNHWFSIPKDIPFLLVCTTTRTRKTGFGGRNEAVYNDIEVWLYSANEKAAPVCLQRYAGFDTYHGIVNDARKLRTEALVYAKQVADHLKAGIVTHRVPLGYDAPEEDQWADIRKSREAKKEPK